MWSWHSVESAGAKVREAHSGQVMSALLPVADQGEEIGKQTVSTPVTCLLVVTCLLPHHLQVSVLRIFSLGGLPVYPYLSLELTVDSPGVEAVSRVVRGASRCHFRTGQNFRQRGRVKGPESGA